MSSSPSRRNRSSEVSRKNSIRGERNNENSRSNDSNKNSVHVSDDSDFNTRGHGPPKIEGMVSLKVDNITQRTGVNLLKKVFGKFGDLGDIYVPRYPDTFASRGFAFVRYYRKRDAEDAMHAMNGERLDGRILSIQMARYARPSPNKLSDKHLSSKRTHYHSDFRRNGVTTRYRRTSYNDRSFSRRNRSRSRSRDRRKYNSRQSARSRSRTRSRSRSASRSRSRTRSRSRSRSKARTSKRRTRYRSRTKSKSRSRSRSRNRSQSRNSSKSVSQEKKIKTEDISEKGCNLTEPKDRHFANINVKTEENAEKTHLESRHRDSRSKSHSNSR